MEKEEFLDEDITTNLVNELKEPNLDFSSIVSKESSDWINKETVVVIIKNDGDKIKNLSSILLCGKPMVDWVKLATSGPVQKVINMVEPSQFLNTLKGLGVGKKYLAVFYSDTPLLERSTFCEIMDCFARNRYNIMELPRGYVFNVEYLLNLDVLFSPVKKSFNIKQFEQIDNPRSLSNASKILQTKILEYHKDNGVTLFGENTIFIDADVEIEEGSIIYPNNILKGQTFIGKNVVLESGNIIEDSIVKDEATIVSSYILKSKIGQKAYVGPFAKIDGEVFGD